MENSLAMAHIVGHDRHSERLRLESANTKLDSLELKRLN
jgi:hypothetical protein